MFGGPISFKPVVFTEAPDLIKNVRSEYYIDGKKIKFHFWADPQFPENFGEYIAKAFINVPKDNIIIEYVPEVESWYAEIKEAAFKPTGSLVTSLIAKIGKVVSDV
tara:strand:+ start:106 stop:423 length:318 start_codon:yes stop_codon:yes gene_type:complete